MGADLAVGAQVRMVTEIGGDVSIHVGDVGMISDLDPYNEDSYWVLMNDGQETGAYGDQIEPL